MTEMQSESCSRIERVKSLMCEQYSLTLRQSNEFLSFYVREYDATTKNDDLINFFLF